MEKDWYKSKACWAGVLLLATAIVNALRELVAGTPVDWQTFVTTASNGLGVLGIRLALK